MKIAVIGEFRLPAGTFDDARPVMRTMLEATRAEEGCISYAFAQDVLEPDLVRVSEVWESIEHLGAHAATAHMAEWRAAHGRIGISGRSVVSYAIASERAV